jgi:hypothetical protein
MYAKAGEMAEVKVASGVLPSSPLKTFLPWYRLQTVKAGLEERKPNADRQGKVTLVCDPMLV